MSFSHEDKSAWISSEVMREFEKIAEDIDLLNGLPEEAYSPIGMDEKNDHLEGVGGIHVKCSSHHIPTGIQRDNALRRRIPRPNPGWSFRNFRYPRPLRRRPRRPYMRRYPCPYRYRYLCPYR